jgi:hypothetical protein
MTEPKRTFSGRLISEMRKQPAFNVAGGLRHVADLLEAGVVNLEGHQVIQDHSDLVVVVRAKLVSAEHLEMMNRADEHPTVATTASTAATSTTEATSTSTTTVVPIPIGTLMELLNRLPMNDAFEAMTFVPGDKRTIDLVQGALKGRSHVMSAEEALDVLTRQKDRDLASTKT